jgi:2-polyprenyl-3-methyl-5-hydroxy-6-metoxy-1,4-benzoquinol methylase
MHLSRTRACPICGGWSGTVDHSTSFPYATLFNNTRFNYLKCACCFTVFVDPIPDSLTFGKMYAKNVYHDCHYDGAEGGVYTDSARSLRRHLPAGSLILDYGCGGGAFLKALKSEGFVPYGVEFDTDAARFAGNNASCEVLSTSQFADLTIKPCFDAIHLGDVLEHLPDPAATLNQLLDYLRLGGFVFVEGPLEVNPSPVFWSARTYGMIKRIIRPGFISTHPPTHLFRTGERAQFNFFMRHEFSISPISWRVHEKGWPYINGGAIKHAIAVLALKLGGRKFIGITFGNRFEGLFIKRDGQSIDDNSN